MVETQHKETNVPYSYSCMHRPTAHTHFLMSVNAAADADADETVRDP